jgi:deazaflavin-dependent oxidoreductase (nitroreductase family)
MMYVPDGDRLLVIASNAGAPRHPDWYHNLVANPRVTVEANGETYPATAVITHGAERDRLFKDIAAQYPSVLKKGGLGAASSRTVVRLLHRHLARWGTQDLHAVP